MSKTITLTEHRPADGMLTMRVKNTTYNVNIFFNPNAKSTCLILIVQFQYLAYIVYRTSVHFKDKNFI